MNNSMPTMLCRDEHLIFNKFEFYCLQFESENVFEEDGAAKKVQFSNDDLDDGHVNEPSASGIDSSENCVDENMDVEASMREVSCCENELRCPLVSTSTESQFQSPPNTGKKEVRFSRVQVKNRYFPSF